MAGEDEKEGKDHGEFKRSLTFWKLCALTFASVAGGPYGFEEAVGAGGPYLTIVGLLLVRPQSAPTHRICSFRIPPFDKVAVGDHRVVPFIWSVPNALMTAELACMMPGMVDLGVSMTPCAFCGFQFVHIPFLNRYYEIFRCLNKNIPARSIPYEHSRPARYWMLATRYYRCAYIGPAVGR
eukprot:1178167-Prorocentrum_minimum.AAC.2